MVDITLKISDTSSCPVGDFRESCADDIKRILQDGARLKIYNSDTPAPLRAIKAETYASTFQTSVLIDTTRTSQNEMSFRILSKLRGLSDVYEDTAPVWVSPEFRKSLSIRYHLPSNMLWVYS